MTDNSCEWEQLDSFETVQSDKESKKKKKQMILIHDI